MSEKITLKWLKENHACTDGLDWFLGQQETDLKAVLLKLIDERRSNWCFWVLTHKLNLKQKKQLAVFSAKEVLDIFKKKYPKDKQPILAIKAAERVIKNDTEENRNNAAIAANDVYAAASNVIYAVANAAYAASLAASSAKCITNDVCAAYAIEAAAFSAGAVTVNDRRGLQVRIVNYGLSLLHENDLTFTVQGEV